jgi:Phospholipase_D-nuclease N-terminal
LNADLIAQPNAYQSLEECAMNEATSYFSIAVAVIILLVDLWAIVSVFRSEKSVGTKAAWAIGLIVFPVLGLIVWGIAGPRGVKEGPSSPEHSKG